MDYVLATIVRIYVANDEAGTTDLGPFKDD